MALIAPSLLSADFLNLEKDCRMLNNSKADWFHIDVMDGHFVPNISFGPMIVDFIHKAAEKYCDVHLMISEPEKYAVAFKKAGADNLTVHIETCADPEHILTQIKNLDMHAGLAINPGTPIEYLRPWLKDVQLVCLMSVHPGFGGQSFIEESHSRISELRKIREELNLSFLIEVDGGVTLENAASIIQSGADVLVAGNTVFRNPDPAGVIEKLKQL